MSDGWPDTAIRGHTLPVGTRIAGVEITGLIGEGGFGIVYLAWDPSLQRRVAVKEYMPSSLASRSADGAGVTVKSERHRDTFEAGRKSFVNEARLLARFDHPGLVKVYRFWEAHGTAYMMMPYYEGPTLKAELDRRDRPPDESELRVWLEPLLDALALMHAARCFHRDIAPDNIILGAAGPLLLDFGAARRVIGDMTQALTVVLKPGYAPIEQYGESARMQQGAWTDLYALGCVLHYAITGRAPMSSVERLMDDALVPLSRAAAGAYSPRFLRAVDALLAVRPEHRPQHIAQFRALLGTPDVEPQVGIADVPPSMPTPTPTPMPMPMHVPMPDSKAAPTRSSETTSTRPTRRVGLVLTGLCAITLAGGMGWMALRRSASMGAPMGAAMVHPSASAASTNASVSASTALPAPSSAAASHEPATFVRPHAASGAPSADAAPAMNTNTTLKPSAGAPPRGPASSTIRPVPTAKPALSPRCSEILQKASLESVSPAERDFLKRECQ